jgi:hypothetical protein
MIVFLKFTAASTVLFTADVPTVAFPPELPFLPDTGEDTARDLCFVCWVSDSGVDSILLSEGRV